MLNPSNFLAGLKKGGKSLVSVDIDKESQAVNYERISEQEPRALRRNTRYWNFPV